MSTAGQTVSGHPTVDDQLVYVVDDDLMIGEVVQTILKMGGYSTTFFQDPELAWRTVSEADPKPALLLTDYRMGPIDGMELIKRCKQQQPGLRTILYSGHACEDIQRYAVEPDGLLRKPFAPKTLLDLVRSVLRSDVDISLTSAPASVSSPAFPA